MALLCLEQGVLQCAGSSQILTEIAETSAGARGILCPWETIQQGCVTRVLTRQIGLRGGGGSLRTHQVLEGELAKYTSSTAPLTGLRLFRM